jgi:very-short-patch-repair endonuclease
LECEGFEYDGNRLTWKRDKRRTAWIEAQDWRLLFLAWDDVTKRPDETIARIQLALA